MLKPTRTFRLNLNLSKNSLCWHTYLNHFNNYRSVVYIHAVKQSYLVSHYLLFYDFSFAILASSMAVVIGALLRLSTQVIKKEFRFYLAKGYCIVASKKGESDLDRMKYLLSSLDSYNKYLLRKIKFGIKNINKIYSDIIIHTDEKKKDEIISLICHSPLEKIG